MSKGSSVTFRLPRSVKDRIAEIAVETDRSLSNTVLWLLTRGIDAYASDGILVIRHGPDGFDSALPKILASELVEAIESLEDGAEKEEIINQIKQIRTDARALSKNQIEAPKREDVRTSKR